ncbi:hypothetical protein M5361_13775 [Ligilactobacillus agilis]|nr:hypothetical protein [Ligilactobacillus agilis]
MEINLTINPNKDGALGVDFYFIDEVTGEKQKIDDVKKLSDEDKLAEVLVPIAVTATSVGRAIGFFNDNTDFELFLEAFIQSIVDSGGGDESDSLEIVSQLLTDFAMYQDMSPKDFAEFLVELGSSYAKFYQGFAEEGEE